MDHNSVNNSASSIPGHNWLEVVRQQVESLRFGAVEIIVHDARVTQIETTERLRFEKGSSIPAAESLRHETGAWVVHAKENQPQ